jgi:hypothetical protein
MTDFLLPFALAFFFRCRGGFIGLRNTQAARALWWALPVALATANPLCGAGAFLGLLIPPGKFEGDASLKSILGMALIGTAQALLILGPMAYARPPALLAAPFGALRGLAYFIGWRFLDGRDGGLRFAHSDGTSDVFARGGSEWGEVLTGFIFGIAILLAGAL